LLVSRPEEAGGHHGEGLHTLVVAALQAEAARVRVLGQQAHAAEGLLAAGAGVLLVLEVGLQVRAQVGLVSEGSGALCAGEGFLAGVGAEVALQQPGPGEGLAALVALAGQRVGADVHLEGAGGVVRLVAVFTRGLALDLVRTVELLVLGEP